LRIVCQRADAYFDVAGGYVDVAPTAIEASHWEDGRTFTAVCTHDSERK
jgi:hypothetical protein